MFALGLKFISDSFPYKAPYVKVHKTELLRQLGEPSKSVCSFALGSKA